MATGDRTVPVVVLCKPPWDDDRAPALFGPDRDSAGRTVGALAALDPFAGPRERDEMLCAAAEPLTQLGAVRAAAEDDGAAILAESTAQEYFNIRTVTGVQPELAAGYAASIMAQALADLRSAPISGTDLARLATAMCRLLEDLGGRAAPAATPSHRPLQQQTARHWFARWIIGHQLHALFNVYAAAGVGGAVASVRRDDPVTAVRQLDRARTYVEAFGPARAYALTVPSWFYNDVLRPTMMPPLCPVPLSGRMHLEYQVYRTQIKQLLAALPSTVTDFARAVPDLALAREALLEADLADAERHLCLVEPVVGHAKSLVQSAKTTENALSMLRTIRNRRAHEIRPFVRYHERYCWEGSDE